jgi:pimeloyl-ACP methyl ester carboxylesterase
MKVATALTMLAVLLVVTIPHLASTEERTRPMSRARLDGVELEYEVRGVGEPVVLVHAGVFAGWYKPLLDEPALAGQYRVLTYHRIGYAGSSRVAGSVSIAQQAAHLGSLMRHLGIQRAHLVGHSSAGNIILQLAMDAPEMVGSLAVLEPALPVEASGSERLLSTRAFMAPVIERYRAGDKAGAVDGFMRGVTGSDYRIALDRVLPGAFGEAVASADTFFGQELPAVRQWSFRREDARRITQPVLAVIGEKSKEQSPIWNARQEMLLTWLPNAEGFVLPGATHLLYVENPRGMAESLAAFFVRHPLKGRDTQPAR